jgi:hypothetical protein
VAGHPRRPIRGDLLADVRPQAIGADQQRSRDAFAGREPRRHRRTILLVACYFRTDAQLDQFMALTRLQEYAMQIAAMHHRIGVAEAGAKGVAQIDMGDFFGGQRIHQPELIDIDGHATRGLADAEIIEGVKRVGAELDAGADLAERRGLLQQN